MSRRRAFTLIEMLLVVSLIVLLISILLPTLRHSRGVARVASCANQLHQVHIAVHDYQTMFRMRRPWQFANGSGDYPHESGNSPGRPGTPARALVTLTKILPDGRLFFCPDVPVVYEKVYDPQPPETFVKFHGTYAWHYHKVRAGDDATPKGNGIIWSNNASKDLLMIDNSNNTWSSWGHPYSFEHYNTLMLGGEVVLRTRNQQEALVWLWGPEKKPY